MRLGEYRTVCICYTAIRYGSLEGMERVFSTVLEWCAVRYHKEEEVCDVPIPYRSY
jgi:hypothetical protein